VHDIPGRHAARIGTAASSDYHLHLNYARCTKGWCSIRTSKTVIPGWLDKAFRHRHRATEHLDNVLVVSPRPNGPTLPNAKLPTATTSSTTVTMWRADQGLDRGSPAEQRLRDEFADG